MPDQFWTMICWRINDAATDRSAAIPIDFSSDSKSGSGERASAFQAFSEEDWLGGALFWLGQAYGQVIDGEATVEEALDTAQQMADDYRACIIAAGDASEDTWQACVQEIDPTLPSFLFGAGE